MIKVIHKNEEPTTLGQLKYGEAFISVKHGYAGFCLDRSTGFGGCMDTLGTGGTLDNSALGQGHDSVDLPVYRADVEITFTQK